MRAVWPAEKEGCPFYFKPQLFPRKYSVFLTFLIMIIMLTTPSPPFSAGVISRIQSTLALIKDKEMLIEKI